MNLRWTLRSIAGPMVLLSSLALPTSTFAQEEPAEAPETTSESAEASAPSDTSAETTAEAANAEGTTESSEGPAAGETAPETKTVHNFEGDSRLGTLNKPVTTTEDHVALNSDVPAPPSHAEVGVEWNSNQEAHEHRYDWKLDLGGYIRSQFTTIEDDPDFELFGRNDGFVMANARLTVAGTMRDELGFKLQLDGAVDRTINGSDRPVTEVDTRLRDANIWWEPLRYTRLTVGQFKPAFDVEEQFSTNELLFIDRSVVSRGVQGVEGFNVNGLSRDREVGAMLSARPIYFGGADHDAREGFGVGYQLAVTNGLSSNYTLNDNDKFAGYGRLEVLWGELVRVGGAVMMNDETIGIEAADQTEVAMFGWTADLTVTAAGLTLIGNMVQTKYEYTELEQQPNYTATGFMAQVGYQEPFFGFQPVFRFANFDPSSAVEGQTNDIVFENDALTYYSFGLNYNPRYPIRLMLNYTVAQEQEGRELDNNRFDALMQVTW